MNSSLLGNITFCIVLDRKKDPPLGNIVTHHGCCLPTSSELQQRKCVTAQLPSPDVYRLRGQQVAGRQGPGLSYRYHYVPHIFLAPHYNAFNIKEMIIHLCRNWRECNQWHREAGEGRSKQPGGLWLSSESRWWQLGMVHV